MKKTLRLWICLALCAGLFCGCLPDASRSAAPVPFSGFGESGEDISAVPAEKTGKLTVALPTSLAPLAGVLRKLAEADGTELNVRTAADGSGYAAGVRAMMAGGDAPGVVWLAGNEQAEALGGTSMLADLSREVASPSFGALAAMVPAGGRLLKETAVYGLPLGDYAEGYLVNLELLGALLGATNLTILQQDLEACTFAQFSALANALEQYLARPGRMRLKVGDNTYQTPDFRPKQAQPVRGFFAVPDADADALMAVALPVAVAVAQDAESQKTDAEEDAAGQVLLSLLGMLDFETMHMGRREGAMRRGEDYASLEIGLLAEEAQQQFAAGTALFMRGDSRTGFLLEEEYPALKGQLALVPLKFPLPEEEEEDAADASGSSSSSESESESSTSSTSETSSAASDSGQDDSADAFDMAALLQEYSQTVWAGSGGYLCLTKAGAQSADAQALLLRLFTTEEGIDAVKSELQLQPFGDLFPDTPLARQVAAAMQDGTPVLPPQSETMARAQVAVGGYFSDELMGKAEWGEEEVMVFLSTCTIALGSLLDAPPTPDKAAASSSSSPG